MGNMGWPKTKGLIKYWTKGPGLARWASSPHPYTALTTALRAEGVPGRYVNGLAAEYFKRVFGIYPGQRKGKAGGNRGHGKRLGKAGKLILDGNNF